MEVLPTEGPCDGVDGLPETTGHHPADGVLQQGLEGLEQTHHVLGVVGHLRCSYTHNTTPRVRSTTDTTQRVRSVETIT